MSQNLQQEFKVFNNTCRTDLLRKALHILHIKRKTMQKLSALTDNKECAPSVYFGVTFVTSMAAVMLITYSACNFKTRCR